MKEIISQYLPPALNETGPYGLAAWQWIALPLLAVVAYLAGVILCRATRALLVRLASRTETKWDDVLIERLSAPFTLAWALLAATVLVPCLELPERGFSLCDKLIHAGFFVFFFWTLLRGVDVGREILAVSRWATEHPASRSLLPLGGRIAKVLVLAMAVVAVLSEFGFSVASLVAGLGIGGLAIALAAQKTVENMFGAFSMGVDQPFRVGDLIQVEGVVGTVESIGLRSTRIRTPDRTLVTLPNGKLAEMRVECVSSRDRIRLAVNLGLAYGATSQQVRSVLAGVERALREHPKIWPDVVNVRLQTLGESAMIVEVVAWFQTVDLAEFTLIRQELLLRFLEVVESAGCALAYPTRTVHLVK